jgi:stress-induced morphogen
MKAEEIISQIRRAIPDAEVLLEDLTGTADHWRASIISTAFRGKTLLARQRMINAALAEELRGPIHALSMQVLTPEESAATPSLAPPPSPGTL